jgi:integrase
MGQGKQAKVLTETQIKAVLATVDGRRYPKRGSVMVLLSIRAGLRAKEIAMARWSMVSDAEGNIGDALHLPNKASKGKNGGRTVWLRAELRDVQELAGHTSLSTTQRYIQGDTAAKRRVVDL